MQKLLIYLALLVNMTSLPIWANEDTKLFKGAKKYILLADAEKSCTITQEELKQSVNFPISYSQLSSVGYFAADIYIHVILRGIKNKSSNTCSGYLKLTVFTEVGGTIPFNNTKKVAIIQLFESGYVFKEYDKKAIQGASEKLAKMFITKYNNDNK